MQARARSAPDGGSPGGSNACVRIGSQLQLQSRRQHGLERFRRLGRIDIRMLRGITQRLLLRDDGLHGGRVADFVGAQILRIQGDELRRTGFARAWGIST